MRMTIAMQSTYKQSFKKWPVPSKFRPTNQMEMRKIPVAVHFRGTLDDDIYVQAVPG